MKILHIGSDSHGRYGGMGTSMINLIDALECVHVANQLLIPPPTVKCDTDFNVVKSSIKMYDNDYVTPLNISFNCHRAIKSALFDLIHINGIWQYPPHCAAKIGRAKKAPYLITPHGMLYPETFRRSYWKKWPMWKIWFRKDVMCADCLHATCETEKNHLRDLGYKGPIAVIGNPVSVAGFTDKLCNQRAVCVKKDTTNVRTIGFLGRLHPRKNVEAIIRGMAAAKCGDEVRLMIMGAGEKDYEEFLRGEAWRLGVEKRVEFAGFVNGEEKFRKLSQLSALFVPSDMENFGMIVPEALLVGTPVMASLGTPWKDLDDFNCGWWRDNSPESVAAVIDEVAEKSPVELLDMGMRGRKLVLEKYEASKVASKMFQLYSWLLGKADRPDFVYEL